MNEETLDLLGQFANELLKDDRFKTFQTLFGQQMAYDILTTAPHETKKRESIHASYTGFGEFIALMQQSADRYVQKYSQPTQAADEEMN